MVEPHDRNMPLVSDEVDESAFISRLEDNIQVPDDLKSVYASWDGLRKYVEDPEGAAGTEDAVVTNFILRTQFAVLANILPADPRLRLVPDEWIPEIEQLAPEMQPMAAMQMGPSVFETYPQEWIRYTKTQELVVHKQQQLGGLIPVLRGLVQDALTLPLVWLKLRWIEDYALDPVGMRREDDALVTAAARYDSLKNAWDDKIFTEDDARHYEMTDLNRTLKDRMSQDLAVSLAEQPPVPVTDVFGEVIADDPRTEELRDLQSDKLLDAGSFMMPPHYQGFAFEAIDPEDMRFDWNVIRHEDMRFAWWQAQRVFMAPREVGEKWKLTPEEAAALNATAALYNRDGTPSGVGDTEDKAGQDERRRNSDQESQTRGKFVAVWEYWDRRANMVYRWVQGYGRLLDKFQPVGTPRRFFPFFALALNRVTGKLFAPPDAKLLRPLQEEINMLRTHDSEARRSSYPRYMVTKGLLGKRAKQQMRRAVPYEVIEVEKASEIQQNIFPLIPAIYNPQLYDGSRARQDYEAMSGMSQSSLGVTGGADLATEAAIAQQQIGVQSNNRQKTILELLTDIYEAMIQVNAQRMDEPTAMAIAGPGATMLQGAQERASVLNNYAVQIEATPNSLAEKQHRLKNWMDASTIVMNLGLPLNRIEVTKEVLRLLDVRTNLSRFIDFMALLAPPPAPGGAAEESPEDAGKAHGGEGGRPPMSEQSGPPGPESVPNRPQV